jgi:hypothetical protein
MPEQEDAMNTQQKDQKPAPKSRGTRISPEIDEFLHMMNSLEAHLAGPIGPANDNR